MPKQEPTPLVNPVVSVSLVPLQVVEKVEDVLGKGCIIYGQGTRWRLFDVGDTIMACVPGPEALYHSVSGTVPWWVTSFDCRGSLAWPDYLRIFEECWPGLYQGLREEKERA